MPHAFRASGESLKETWLHKTHRQSRDEPAAKEDDRQEIEKDSFAGTACWIVVMILRVHSLDYTQPAVGREGIVVLRPDGALATIYGAWGQLLIPI